MNGCECYTNVRNPQDNGTDYNMGITVSVPGERVPRKRYPRQTIGRLLSLPIYPDHPQ